LTYYKSDIDEIINRPGECGSHRIEGPKIYDACPVVRDPFPMVEDYDYQAPEAPEQPAIQDSISIRQLNQMTSIRLIERDENESVPFW
jgi:hypothetical protein